MRSILSILSVCTIFGTSDLEAVIAMNSSSSEWDAILYAGDSDPSSDQQTGTGGGESDIVGSAVVPALYKKFDATSDQLAFRIRLGGDDNPSGFDGAAIIAFDVNADGNLDGYIGVEEKGIGQGSNKYDIGIFEFTGAANTPNATESSLADPKDYEFAETISSVNYDWSTVSSIDSGGPNDVDGLGNDDYFLTFAVDFSDLASVLGIDQDDTFSVVAITSNNLNQINNDFNGIDNRTVDGDVEWDDPSQPITSLPYTPESSDPVPELSSYGLLMSLFCLGFIGVRRRAQR